ncbi:unnamed protein product [Heligmosomoides polygyrus]|uniref:AAA domain-containing protein n=1 Tax=Heligmosomoides polygyrus TaxID=6339 RepID=A0A3P8DTM9_HELPZ|nr:unnamed protein product [Heligmosomoides polygyrus]
MSRTDLLQIYIYVVSPSLAAVMWKQFHECEFQNIDNIVCFDDIEDSITGEFKKAAERSDSSVNVFFTVPHVDGVNSEAEYYLINPEDTLLDIVRGKLVVDRPRFLIALKSQSVKFLHKVPFDPSNYPPTFGPGPGPSPFGTSTFAPPPGPSPFSAPPPGAPLGMQFPNYANPVSHTSTAQPAETASLHKPCVEMLPVTVKKGAGTRFSPAAMAKRDQSKLLEYPWEVQKELLFKLPLNRVLNLFYHLRGNTHGDPTLNNFLSLIPNRLNTAGIAKLPLDWKLTDDLPMLSGFKPLTGIIPISVFEIDDVADNANFEQVAKSVLAQIPDKPRRTGTSPDKEKGMRFTPAAMARRDEKIFLSHSWEAQKEFLNKLPLKRILNLMFHIKARAGANAELNKILSLIPRRLESEGVAKLPKGWKLTDRLVWQPGFKALPDVTPITMFEIDDAADIANFEKIARTVETLASSNPDSARNGSERKAGFIEKPDIVLTPSMMAKFDMDRILEQPWDVQKSLIFKLPLKRVLNLFYHMRGRTHGNPTLNNIFKAEGIVRLPPEWRLSDDLPMMPGRRRPIGVVPITRFKINEAADRELFKEVEESIRSLPFADGSADSAKTKMSSPAANAGGDDRQNIAVLTAPNQVVSFKDMIMLSRSEMAYWDYTLLKSVPNKNSAIHEMKLSRVILIYALWTVA